MKTASEKAKDAIFDNCVPRCHEIVYCPCDSRQMFMDGFDYAIELLKSDEARMHESGELTLGNPLNGLDHEEWAKWLEDRR